MAKQTPAADPKSWTTCIFCACCGAYLDFQASKGCRYSQAACMVLGFQRCCSLPGTSVGPPATVCRLRARVDAGTFATEGSGQNKRCERRWPQVPWSRRSATRAHTCTVAQTPVIVLLVVQGWPRIEVQARFDCGRSRPLSSLSCGGPGNRRAAPAAGTSACHSGLLRVHGRQGAAKAKTRPLPTAAASRCWPVSFSDLTNVSLGSRRHLEVWSRQ